MILTLYLTMRCNQRCSYCYAKPHRNADMALETAKNAIVLAAKRLNQLGQKSLGIRFFEGEPLLVWDLIPVLVDFSNQIGEKYALQTSFAIATNGTLLTEDYCDFLLKHDFAVGLSIDGSEQVHNRNRKWINGSGSFIRTIENAKMAIDKNLRAELVLVSDPTTVNDLAESVRYLHDETAGHFFTISFNIHKTWNQADIINLEKSFHKLAELYVDYFNQGQPIQIDFINNKINVLVRGGFIKEYLCEIGKTDLAITPEGNIYPCLRLAAMDAEGLTIIGNVKNGLNELLLTNLKQAVDKRFDKSTLPLECGLCSNPESCLNWCAAANLAMTGNPAKVGELMCKYEKLSIDIAKKILSNIDVDAYKMLYKEYLTPFLPFYVPPATPHGEVGVYLN